MQYQTKNQNKQTHQGKTLNDPQEFNRLLMMYGGIFKHNIKEFADKMKKNRPIKNYSR